MSQVSHKEDEIQKQEGRLLSQKKEGKLTRIKNIFGRKFKITLCIIGVVALYIVVGAIGPFLIQKEVNPEYKEKFQTEDFYSDTIGVDRAAIIEDSDEALEVRLHMIEQAQERILFSTFSIKNDRASQEFCAALYAAANRGVKVEMLIDGLSGGIDMERAPMYYALGAHENVEIRYYNPLNLLKPWTANGRLHDKYLVIDNEFLLLGGRNTSNYFVGTYNKNVLSYDRDVFVYNTEHEKDEDTSVIYQVTKYFESIYDSDDVNIAYENTPYLKKSKVEAAKVMLRDTYDTMRIERPELFVTEVNYDEYTMETNKITLLYNPTHIMSKEPYLWYSLCQLMEEAKERVYIQTPYAVLNKDMYEDLTSIGQKVEDFNMILNSIAVGDNICASSDYILNKDKIIDTGVQIYEFQGEHSMHNKSVLIDDDISVVGSFNFDMRSAYLDTETMLVIHGEEFNQELTQCIKAMVDQSLPVDSKGEYVMTGNVEPKELSTKKKIIFSVSPYALWPFRFLL